MSNFWDQDSTSEWETIEETLDDQAQAVLDEFEDEEEYEEDYDEDETEEYMEDYEPTKGEAAYKLDKRESSVLNDATIRLEQARLYDMLIKHDLFAGVKANPRALHNVQNELKAYIVSRLEILLGIRKEVVEEEEERQIIVESPFNDIEIEFLKALSYKGTKGASAQAGPKHLAASEIKPLSSNRQEPAGLKPLGSPVQQYEEEEEEYEEEPAPRPRKAMPKKAAPKKKPAPKKKTQPQKQVQREPVRQVPSKAIQRKRRGEMTNAEAEEIAREELAVTKGKSKLHKHPYEMTAKELKELAKQSSKSQVKKIPANALPPATSDQAAMLVQQQQLQMQSKPGSAGVSLLVQKLINDKNR